MIEGERLPGFGSRKEPKEPYKVREDIVETKINTTYVTVRRVGSRTTGVAYPPCSLLCKENINKIKEKETYYMRNGNTN